MARARKGRVGEDPRDGLALLEHPLQPKEVPVDALAVCGPCCVLQVARDGTAEEGDAIGILNAYGTTVSAREEK